jgi:hypothetical protein
MLWPAGFLEFFTGESPVDRREVGAGCRAGCLSRSRRRRVSCAQPLWSSSKRRGSHESYDAVREKAHQRERGTQ